MPMTPGTKAPVAPMAKQYTVRARRAASMARNV